MPVVRSEKVEYLQMQAIKRRLNEKEFAWIRAFFEVGGNATEATRRVYGGTDGGCRVRGHRKRKKMEPILKEIAERGFHKMACEEVDGIRFFLGNLAREAEEHRNFMRKVGGYRGLLRMLKKIR